MGNSLKPSGSRQRVWEALRRARSAQSYLEIAKRAEAEPLTAQRYLSALKKIGYVEHDNQTFLWLLTNNTGAIAPIINANGHFRDLNIDPPPSPSDLKNAISDSGLSIAQWCVRNNLRGQDTRIRQMCEGSRPISRNIEALISV